MLCIVTQSRVVTRNDTLHVKVQVALGVVLLDGDLIIMVVWVVGRRALEKDDNINIIKRFVSRTSNPTIVASFGMSGLGGNFASMAICNRDKREYESMNKLGEPN